LHLHLLFFHVLVKNSWQIGLYKICVSIGRGFTNVSPSCWISIHVKIEGWCGHHCCVVGFYNKFVDFRQMSLKLQQFHLHTQRKVFFPSMLHKCSININNRTKAMWSQSVLTLLIIIVVAVLVVALAYAWNTHFLRFYNFCVSSMVSLAYNGLINFLHFC